MNLTNPVVRFPRQPRNARHLYVVCRVDGPDMGSLVDRFTLTRGYWAEDEANRRADELNAGVVGAGVVYFCQPARVSDA
jgi:hypothetical protein